MPTKPVAAESWPAGRPYSSTSRWSGNAAAQAAHAVKEGPPAAVLTQALIDVETLQPLSEQERRLRQKAVSAVMQGTRWLTAAELGLLRDKTARNLHSAASRWLEQARVFALDHRGARVFPAYGFDELGEPLAAMRPVLEQFQGCSGFRIAAWFESDNSHLGAKPRTVLATQGPAVLDAARRHLLGPVHG